MFEVKFTPVSQKQLEKLEKAVQERIVNCLERLRFSPEKHVKKLVGFDAYRLRVGDYRVILEIKKNEPTILIHKIGHRKNIYKNI